MRKYICLHCFHEWNSNGTHRVLRCSRCHRRQGVGYDKFREAVDVTRISLLKIADSPPPHRPPLEVIGNIPDALEPVLEVAKSEFPNPLVPISLLREIFRRAVEELKDISRQDGQ